MRASLHTIADQAADFLASLPTRPVASRATAADLRGALERPLAEDGAPAELVIEELIRDVDPGLVASAGPRYFGFVVGGATRASLMADWLTSAWDQNAQVYATAPAAAVTEEIVARWILELLGLPAQASVGLVTGGQMANFTALSCARNAVLERAGWDLEEQGLFGAPPITVLMSECAHSTIRSAARMMGLGATHLRGLPSDAQGRIELSMLDRELRRVAGQPVILALQAGNVNTGAYEPVGAIADRVQGHNAWLHVDGAFGLWARACPEHAAPLDQVERADSWSTDAHKWLNVPYDSGLVIVKDAAHHRRLKTGRCSYAGEEIEEQRDGSTWVPENSRRARAFVLYAVLRTLGRSGVRELVSRGCELARLAAAGAARLPHAELLNEVVLNQVLVHFAVPGHEDPEALHRAIVRYVQEEGHCWIGTTSWKGQAALRISICNWSTTAEDIATLLSSLGRALHAAAPGRSTTGREPDGPAR